MGLPLTLAEGFFHRLWYGAREPFAGIPGVPAHPARVGGGGWAATTPQSDFLFMAIFWISVVSFVFLMVLMVVFTAKYRRRPGVAIERSPAHNTPLELTWTVVPLIALVWIFFEGFWGYMAGQTGGSLPEEIDLKAQKWNWSMTYSNGGASPLVELVGASQVPVFVVPAGRPVLLKMHSLDVIHSFWVPDFRWKQDVFPNRYTAFVFQTESLERLDPRVVQVEKHGDGSEYPCVEHYIFCAEYCGDQHSEMAAILRVVPPADYVKILEDWANPRGTPEEVGAALYKIKGCISCHSVDGSPKTGPTWKNLYGHEVPLAGGGTVLADENYLRESILVPAAKIVQGYPNSMVSFQGQLSEEQLSALIAYIKSLSDKAPASLLDKEGGAAPADQAPGGGGN